MTRFLPFGSRSKTIQVNTLGGGAPAVTYATWNPADKGSITLSGGDLLAQSNSGAWNSVRSTISKTSGKWYCEITCGGASGGGIALGSGTSSANLFDFPGTDANGWGIYGGGPNKFHNGSNVAFGSGGNLVAGDIIQISLNMDAGEISIGKNGTDFGLMYSGLGSGPMFIMAGVYNNGTTATANFGATPFAYSVPSGYNEGLYDTVDLSAGLVAHYPLATNSLDTSGNGYDGTVNGTVTFNGTDATFGAGWVSNTVQITADGTHSIWFKTSDASTRMALISKFSGANGQRIYVGDANKLQVVIGGPYTELIGGVAVNDGVYHNALYTWGTGGIKLYIDNVLIASNAATHYNNGGTIMNIGYNEAEWPFIGQLKKARIYNRVLNAGEIAALYAEG